MLLFDIIERANHIPIERHNIWRLENKMEKYANNEYSPAHTSHAKYYKQIVFVFQLARENEKKNIATSNSIFVWRLSIMRYT